MPAASVYNQSGKAQFGHIYNQADPRKYFETLGGLEYQIPAHAAGIFGRLLERRRTYLDRENVVVLDLCCSYGINTALLNHDLTLDALYVRYGSLELSALSIDELVEADRSFYGEHRRSHPVQVVGIDVADQAISYAQRVGLHWAGNSENLETEEPSAELAHQLTGVNMITVTGGIGYITERTFDRVLRHASAVDGCWVLAFALRWMPYERIADVLVRYGLTTEKLSGHTFPQRRFVDEAEQNYVIGELESLGIDPTGKETEGWHHSNFYLSRPFEHNPPALSELLSGCMD